MKIRCILVEDEPLAQERGRQFIGKLGHLQLEGVFDNGLDALQFLKHHPVDLLFLDIQLGELSGIQLLEIAGTKAQVIITTAYPEYALKGYDLQVTDYLLKPYTLERFLQSVAKAEANLLKPASGQDKKFIFVKTEYRLEKVLLEDILYIEGMRDYRRIHTTKGKIMTLQTFGELESEIPSHLVYRVHKSWMVSVQRIQSIERDRIRIGEVYIPVSETYKKGFLEVIKG